MLLEGKKALITGASRGIGRAIAIAFAGAGADLALSARTSAALDEACAAVRARGRQAYAMGWDIADVSQAEARLAEVRQALGRLDILVNNAGVVRLPPDHSNPTPEAVWDYIMDINMKSLYFICEGAARIMEEQKAGVIINLASDAGLRGAPNAYGISKWGVIGYTKGLAKRLAPKGVRVNCIAPGPIATAMMNCEDGKPREAANLPLGRYGLPEEVADVALFLASDLSRAVYGHALVVSSAIT